MGLDCLVMFFFKGRGFCPLKNSSEYKEKMLWRFYHAVFAFCVEVIDLLSKPVHRRPTLHSPHHSPPSYGQSLHEFK